MAYIWLAELTAHNGSTTETLRYCTGRGFTTGPGETPANTVYAPKLKQPAGMRRDAFSAGTTQGHSRMGYGDAVLINNGGELDAILDYGFDGRAYVLRRGLEGAAYPSGFPIVESATMEQPTGDRHTITIKLRDKQLDMERPLQATKYAGDNVLPAGLEGVAADLQGKPKPLAYGASYQAPIPCVNTQKLIYQANDGAIAGIVVFDAGIPLFNNFGGWTTRTNPFGSDPVNAFAASPTLILAVADNGEAASSTDGLTWVDRTAAVAAIFGSSAIRAAVYFEAAALFIIAGDGGKMATSPDCVTWTSRTSGFGTDTIRGLAQGNGVCIAVGSDTSAAGQQISSTTNGTAWTRRSSGFASGEAARAGAYGQGRLVVVGGTTTDEISYSTDGATWTNVSSAHGGDVVFAVAHAHDRFVYVGENGDVGFSVDFGASWAAAPVIKDSAGATVTTDLLAIAYGFGRVFVGGVGGKLFASDDLAQTWSVSSGGFGASDINALIFTADTFFAGGGSGKITSPAASTSYASEAELIDDTLAPAPGTVGVWLAGGMIRLGAPPFGLVTADITQGANAAARTVGQIFVAILTKMGKTGGDWSASDVTALDTANNAVIGFWTDQEVTAASVLDQVASTVGAWWGVDRNGVYRIKRLVLPSGSPVISFVADQMKRPLGLLVPTDPSHGLPQWKTTLRYARYYAVQTSGLAFGVQDDRRSEMGKEWRHVSDDDPAVATKHLRAPEVDEETLFAFSADALTEAARRQTLRGVRRPLLTFGVPLDNDTDSVDLGDVVEVTHNRFGLSAGKDFIVLGVEPDAARHEVSFVIWGGV